MSLRKPAVDRFWVIVSRDSRLFCVPELADAPDWEKNAEKRRMRADTHDPAGAPHTVDVFVHEEELEDMRRVVWLLNREDRDWPLIEGFDGWAFHVSQEVSRPINIYAPNFTPKERRIIDAERLDR